VDFVSIVFLLLFFLVNALQGGTLAPLSATG